MSKRDDISQLIRKYLNGELDARAMHQLEKEAQNDPFLMEALEGYEQSGADQQQNLADVYARLDGRVNKKERRIIPWKWISIAASVLIVLTIGGLWLRQQSPITNKTIVKGSKPKPVLPAAKPTEANKVEAIIHSPAITKQIAKNESHTINNVQKYTVPAISEAKVVESAQVLAATPNAKIRKDTTNLGEVRVVGYGAQAKRSVTYSMQSVPQDYVANSSPAAIANQLSGRVAGVSVVTGKAITGIVKDESGTVLPGVTVKIKGTNIGTQTDANGKFTISNAPKGATLDLAYIGYSQKQVTVNKRDSLVIAMQPNSGSLAEVVVTGYGAKKQDDEQPVYDGAHPANGWSNFKKYLADNAESPDGKTGIVKVSFMVDEYGTLSDFKIKKSLSTETDKAAIELIQNGPHWLTNTNHTSETVTVRVRFKDKQ